MLTFEPIIRLDVVGLTIALVAFLIRQEVRLGLLEGRVKTLYLKVMGIAPDDPK